MVIDQPNRGVIPELRRLHSPDLLDMVTSCPTKPDDFCILVQAMIGPKGGTGEESFDITVCTPRWLETLLTSERALFGLHYLFVDRYDYERIWGAIARICNSIVGATWSDVAQQLGNYGRWEFENYEEHPSSTA